MEPGALRVCSCGAELEEAGAGLVCRSCGPAEVWSVVLDGRLVASATSSEVYFAPAFAECVVAMVGAPEEE